METHFNHKSVFPNYALEEVIPGQSETCTLTHGRTVELCLQDAIELAVSRCFIYRFLAEGFASPEREGWSWMCQPTVHAMIRAAAVVVSRHGQPKVELNCHAMLASLREPDYAQHEAAFVGAFGHASRGVCPVNEIEYGDLNADPLFQPHRLADVGAFYGAFGVDLSCDAAERQDYLAVELEFMSVLAAKEANALECQDDAEHLEVCRAAQRSFIRDHAGRWIPAFCRRLQDTIVIGPLSELARVTRQFILMECAFLGVSPGGDSMALRPVDQDAETLCDSCGLKPSAA